MGRTTIQDIKVEDSYAGLQGLKACDKEYADFLGKKWRKKLPRIGRENVHRKQVLGLPQ